MNAEDILAEIITQVYDKELYPREAIDLFKQRVQTECQQLDGKACGLVWKRKDGTVEEGFFLLVPRDKLAVQLLEFYVHLCIKGNCEIGQVEGAERVVDRFLEWQKIHSKEVKTPDLNLGDNAL